MATLRRARHAGPVALPSAAPDASSRRTRPLHVGHHGQSQGGGVDAAGLHALAQSMKTEYRHDTDTVQLLPTPISHMGGLSNLLAGVLGRSTSVLGASADPDDVLPAISRWSPSLMQLLPTGLDDFVEAGHARTRGPHVPPRGPRRRRQGADGRAPPLRRPRRFRGDRGDRDDRVLALREQPAVRREAAWAPSGAR